MSQKTKSSEKQPFRNPLCRNYEKCLDSVAYQNGRLDCRQCEYRNDQTGFTIDNIQDFEIEGCQILLAAVFHPHTWKGKHAG